MQEHQGCCPAVSFSESKALSKCPAPVAALSRRGRKAYYSHARSRSLLLLPPLPPTLRRGTTQRLPTSWVVSSQHPPWMRCSWAWDRSTHSACQAKALQPCSGSIRHLSPILLPGEWSPALLPRTEQCQNQCAATALCTIFSTLSTTLSGLQPSPPRLCFKIKIR